MATTETMEAMAGEIFSAADNQLGPSSAKLGLLHCESVYLGPIQVSCLTGGSRLRLATIEFEKLDHRNRITLDCAYGLNTECQKERKQARCLAT